MSMIKTRSTKRQRTTELSECEICSATAIYSFFGVKSCSACRVFFRRNAQYGQNGLPCARSNQCDINIHTRQGCQGCRLNKCFSKGMQVGMFRTCPTPKNKKISLVNTLDRDPSLLDPNQWMLLTNLIHNYEEKNLLSLALKISNERNILNRSNVNELIQMFYDAAGNFLRKNKNISELSLSDRSILLHTSSTNLTCFGAQFIYFYGHLIDHELFWSYLNPIYGRVTMDFTRWSAKFAHTDLILSKLALCLFALSNNSRIFYSDIRVEYENSKNILSIENQYVELTWKYLLYKYDFQRSIKSFLYIIQWFLSATVFLSHAHNVQLHINDIETLVERTELELILDDIDDDN